MRKIPAQKKHEAHAPTDPLPEIFAHDRTDSEKRPKETNVEELYLDPKNPRLADTTHTGTQASILRAMAQDFDLQPLIDSMYQNGFFWEEPLVAVLEPLPELKGKKVLIVIEGNRRLAALQTILQNPGVYPDAKARKRLQKVPIIQRGKREETLAFVGFRHITGIVPWDSAAKAQYAHNLVSRGMSLELIAQTIGDKTRDIARWVRTQSLVEHAHEQGLIESDAAKKFYFSYLLTSTDAPATKRWLEMETNEESGLVTSINAERLEELWFWLYGSKAREISPVVPESRQIHKLNQVIASPTAIQELQKTGNLERALIEAKDRGDYIVETLGSIRSLLQDLTANLAGEEKFATSGANSRQLREAQAEFSRVEKALSEVKIKLGF
jgi:hypothetical protein